MANYPAYNILISSSKAEDDSGIEDDYSQAGAQHSRIFFASSYYEFSIDHQLSLDEWDTLKALYDAGPRDVYTLTYYDESPIATYSVKFISPPQIVSNIGGNRFYVRSNLRGTKD
jgi:hypothetical protein